MRVWGLGTWRGSVQSYLFYNRTSCLLNVMESRSVGLFMKYQCDRFQPDEGPQTLSVNVSKKTWLDDVDAARRIVASFVMSTLKSVVMDFQLFRLPKNVLRKWQAIKLLVLHKSGLLTIIIFLPSTTANISTISSCLYRVFGALCGWWIENCKQFRCFHKAELRWPYVLQRATVESADEALKNQTTAGVISSWATIEKRGVDSAETDVPVDAVTSGAPAVKDDDVFVFEIMDPFA